MFEKALAALNKECHKAGVCEAGIKHAAVLWKDGSPRRILMSCWQDGMVTSCVIEEKSGERQCCYTAEGGGDELYYAWQGHLSSPEVGYKVKSIETEEKLRERVGGA